MRPYDLSPRIHDVAAAWAILLALVVLPAVALVAAGAMLLDDRRSEFEQLVRAKVGLSRIIAEQPVIEARRTALSQEAASRTGVLTGSSESVAAAELQTIISRIAGAAGGTIASIAVMPSRPDGALRRLTVLIDASIPEPSFASLLAGLEASETHLLINRLDLRLGSTAGLNPRATPHRLQLTMEIQALLQVSP